MSLHDAMAAGLRGGTAVLDRVDTDRITDVVSDIAGADLVSSLVSAADHMGDQIATVVEHGWHPLNPRPSHEGRTTRVAVAAGIVLAVIASAFLIRRWRKNAALASATHGHVPTVDGADLS